MAGDRLELKRDWNEPPQASYVELFLDVVYVYVLGRITALLAEDLSWRGALQSSLLFLAVWWIWYRLAWTTNRYSPARPIIQLMSSSPCCAVCSWRPRSPGHSPGGG